MGRWCVTSCDADIVVGPGKASSRKSWKILPERRASRLCCPVARIKCLHSTFQQTTHTFTFLHVIQTILTFLQHVLSRSDFVDDLTLTSGGGGDGGVAGQQGYHAKCETTRFFLQGTTVSMICTKCPLTKFSLDIGWISLMPPQVTPTQISFSKLMKE